MKLAAIICSATLIVGLTLGGNPARAQAPEQPQQAQPAPAVQPAPAMAQPLSYPPAGLPAGQWLYTAQYGWIWMPYGTQYTYEPPQADAGPYAYVYGPTLGWSWVAAPWVWGWGAAPYFGVYGGVHYPWYGRAVYGWQHPYYGHAYYGHAYYGHTYYGHPYGGGWHGGATFHGAPVFHGGPTFHGGGGGGFHGGGGGFHGGGHR
ncbi:MAG: hypothetical protein ABUR63_00850 [Verrucomicrobiota bacterium]